MRPEARVEDRPLKCSEHEVACDGYEPRAQRDWLAIGPERRQEQDQAVSVGDGVIGGKPLDDGHRLLRGADRRHDDCRHAVNELSSNPEHGRDFWTERQEHEESDHAHVGDEVMRPQSEQR